ncbi:hypothetical protein ACP3V3_01670 [Vibrio sp. PNB22_3_1]
MTKSEYKALLKTVIATAKKEKAFEIGQNEMLDAFLESWIISKTT